jgi:hypothetical protein
MPSIFADFTSKYSSFIASIRTLWNLEREAQDRPELIHYEELSQQLLLEMEDAGFVTSFQEAWLKKKENPRETIATDLFFLEMESFTNSVTSFNNQDQPQGLRRRLLKVIPIILDSIGKIFGDLLPNWVKAIVDIASEVGKIFEDNSLATGRRPTR